MLFVPLTVLSCVLPAVRVAALPELSEEKSANYANKFHEVCDYDASVDGSEAFISGVESYHQNSEEDRRFKFSARRPPCGSFARTLSAPLPVTDVDLPFTRECGSNEAMAKWKSTYSQEHKDRTFTFTCASMSGVTLDSCDWQSHYGTKEWENDWDQEFDFHCNDGKVLTGVKSEHENEHEDRLYAFQCCRVVWEATLEQTKTGYRNNWDQTFTYDAYVSGKKAAIAGVYSYHDNKKEDRRFGFRARVSCDNPPRDGDTNLQDTSYDASWTRLCGYNQAIFKWHSWHNNKKEDRIFRFTCAKFAGVTIDNCAWTTGGWFNNWDQQFDFQCPSGKVLAGVKSYHDNKKEDRRFRFYCCKYRYTVEPSAKKQEKKQKVVHVVPQQDAHAQLVGFAFLTALVVFAMVFWLVRTAREAAQPKTVGAVKLNYGSCKV